MTDWARLAEPFPENEIKQRPGAAKWDHKPNCEGPRCRETRDESKHMQFSYVDARVVAQRLDDVLTPEGWDFTWTLEPDGIVHGRLIIGGNIREDAGYPNSHDDAEPIKSAVSDALKRCCVLFGIGRHLYDDNHGTARPAPARAAPQRAPAVHRVDTDIMASEEDDLPFDYAEAANLRAVNPTAEPLRCPNHPNREPRQNSRGWYCSGKDPKGKNGFCEWTAAA